MLYFLCVQRQMDVSCTGLLTSWGLGRNEWPKKMGRGWGVDILFYMIRLGDCGYTLLGQRSPPLLLNITKPLELAPDSQVTEKDAIFLGFPLRS